MKKSIKEAEKIMEELTTVTAILMAVIFFGILASVIYSCVFNKVYLFVLASILAFANIQIWKVSMKADSWRRLK